MIIYIFVTHTHTHTHTHTQHTHTHREKEANMLGFYLWFSSFIVTWCRVRFLSIAYNVVANLVRLGILGHF